MANKPFIQAPTPKEALVIRAMILIGCLSIVNFIYWFTREEYRANGWLYFLLSFILLYGVLRTVYMWYHYLNLSVPEAPATPGKYSVDVLTTYFPGEPYEMIEETLKAIQEITYPHTTYLCDEANDPHLIEYCRKLGVVHVTRDNRINAKAGNINNALKIAKGEICVILDPDHVPDPDFLDPIIPHFANPQIGFVQIVQSYYNNRDTLVARGAAEQTYQFYGPMMMTMNSYGTVNAIGANCTFRRSALDSIGGHAPGLSEDMHTAMLLHAKGWKSVYVPRILARGLAPSDLGSYYKQQLKWSRGTFDLLFYVYPRLFRKFNWRQKLHYGLLPLHFLVGTVYLFSFLIPIFSLFMAEAPWSGNIIFFGLFYLPLGMSNILIRAYIQKWVIEKNERGFHLVGGLLQITTWWVYFLGFIYTIFKKKVPYLPTPKNKDVGSSFKIIFPNILIGNFSLLAVIYGLYIDLTPFSLAMAFFALLNAFFMFFSIFLATSKTNKNNILRTGLPRDAVTRLVGVKSSYRRLTDMIFRITRPVALPVLIGVLICSFYFQYRYQQSKWENIPKHDIREQQATYLGIFYPLENDGLSNLDSIRTLENRLNARFDLVSMYLAWGDTSSISKHKEDIKNILDQKRIPLVTWEPWASTFKMSDSIPSLSNEKNVMHYIASGYFDAYIREFASFIKAQDKPVFLRFAHEFDNPAYPWSPAGENQPEEFIKAWRHVHDVFGKLGAQQVVWVWNPWKADCFEKYYPGDSYVDWVGITSLNYESLNDDGQSYSFHELYYPFHQALKEFTAKPVILSEFGTLNTRGGSQEWVSQAFHDIAHTFREISGVVLFNSAVDTNIPYGQKGTALSLNWTLADIPHLPEKYRDPMPDYLFEPTARQRAPITGPRAIARKVLPPFRGVTYLKGQNWYKNHYVLSKDILRNDFRLIKEAGFNAIRYRGSRIYDQNVLKYSREAGLDIIFSIWVPATVDFVSDHQKKEALKRRILGRINQNRSEAQIIGWNLSNDVWKELETVYNEPVLSRQRSAFLLWLNELTSEIELADPDRPLILDLVLGSGTSSRVDQLERLGIVPDSYGIVVKDTTSLEEFMGEARDKKIPYVFNELPPASYRAIAKVNVPPNVILGNWQDQWESDFISLDGMLNFEGKCKEEYFILREFWSGNKPGNASQTLNILKPAELLYADNTAQYQALLNDGRNWYIPGPESRKEAFSWFLVKKDAYGNRLAVKKLGHGFSVSIQIPENYKHYELVLNYEEGGMVHTTLSQLHTSLEHEQEDCNCTSEESLKIPPSP
jgi:cellulose synthase/poly-beta-1,6-N-acetylglucosamine synthase-like glycosyltransferase